MNFLLWAVFPYVCITLFFVVPFIRLRKRPFEFTTRATSLFARRSLGVASLLLHWGILTLIVGHAIGITGAVLGWGGWVEAFFWIGAVGGLMALTGSITAVVRRLLVPELRALSQPDDYLVHLFLIAIMGAALYQSLALWIWGASFNAGLWLASIFRFHPTPELMTGAPLYTRIHVGLALAFIGYFPFTKLVHAWTLPVNYLVRPYQSMRTATRKFQRRFELALRTDSSMLLYSASLVLLLLLAGGLLLRTPGRPPLQAAGGELAITAAAPANLAPAGASSRSAAATGRSGGEALTGYPLYLGSCARCHGVHGDARVLSRNSPSFARPPRDLVRGRFRFVSTVNGVASAADLRHVIVSGLPSAGMPGFGHLSAAQVDSLVEVLYLFWADRPEAGATLDPGPVPELTPALAATGKALFASMCSACHGPGGAGDGPAAATLPVPPANLAAGKVKAGDTATQLYFRIGSGIVGDEGQAMPPFASLGPDQIWSLVAYLRQDVLP